MPGEDDAILVAPVPQPLIIGVGVLLRQGPPEIVADLRRLLSNVGIQGRQIGLQSVAAAFAKNLKHPLRPRDHVILHAHVVIVHRRLVREETGNGFAELMSDGLLVLLVRQLDELFGRGRIERVDVERRLFLQEVHQHPISAGRLPRDRLLPTQVLVQIHRILDDRVVLFAPHAIGRNRIRIAGGHVAVIVGLEKGEDRPFEPQRHELEVALAQIGIGLQHLLLGRAARPVHLVVNPRVNADFASSLDAKFDAIEPFVRQIAHAQAHPTVNEEAAHAAVVILAELPLHLVFVEIAVPEPERHDAHFEGRFREVFAGECDAVYDAFTECHLLKSLENRIPA